jgi:TolA-binding protein
MNKKLILSACFYLIIFINHAVFADESQNLNEFIAKIAKLNEKKDYDEVIKVTKAEIDKGNLTQLYFSILGGAYALKKNEEDAYLTYLKGFLYNPTTEYAKKNLTGQMNYIEHRANELNKDSWLYRYLNAKKSFDDSDIISAEKKIGTLMSENKNIDILCIINKDIKSLKDVPKETKDIFNNLTEAESSFNKVIAQMGDACPEYVYYEFGDLLFKSKKYSAASGNYQISVNKNKARRDNKLKLGVCNLYEKNYKEAKLIFSQCIETYPDYAEAYLYLGFSQWALKESDKAIKSFTEVVELIKTGNTSIKDKAKKAITVVTKGDLFLTPSDMDKIINAATPALNVNKEATKPNDTNKKGKEENEPIDKK